MNISIGDKLKELLKLRRIKYVVLAKHLGISASRLSNYISGKRDPGLEMLAAMAKFLGTDLNYFSNISFGPESKIKRTESDKLAVEVPHIRINEKRKQIRNGSIFLDKTFVDGLENPVIIETDKHICRLFASKTYILASPITDNEVDGSIVIKTGRYPGIYKFIRYGGLRLLYDLKTDKIKPLVRDSIYYAVRLTIGSPMPYMSDVLLKDG